MPNAIILHGLPTKSQYYSPREKSQSNSHWLPWLQQQLLVHDVFAKTPEVPLAYELNWDCWVAEVEQYEIKPDTIIVGHSCGGGFWVRYLSEHTDLRVGKVVLVAPWMDVEGDYTKDFFNFHIDPNLVSRTSGIVIFNSVDDATYIHSTVSKLRSEISGLNYREFSGLGHFTHSRMPDDTFPELLDELVK